ncbi:Bug family tripartite tricarboxylate transporter substrate binding protein [Piscinibacter koreensis]|uniref:Tripartite tricarboxylate transporter substrate binding protein n=1 Tax=Piscinibacter koreensis TaxID=2742824 RepID=A0A7Y6NQW4_9BURK|nr:tripartite tricarboxylate transporter substrate-binding protein [Schlegelella koreensis]NUZ07692.1 tripartite tricarboxylate transporter substrate binding protein [Schlegelella koreensis]
MKTSWRILLAFAAGLVALHAPAQAQGYPSRPIKIIVGYVPGATGPDFSARTIAPKLSQILGQSVIVDNRPGAGGTLATGAVVHSPADGYTLLLGETGQLEIAPYIYKDLSYKTLTDLTPIGMMTDGAGIVIIANTKTTKIRSLDDLIREAKANPGKLSYGSAGIGTIHHLAMEVFKDGVGIDVQHIPYKGGGQALPAFLGGDVPILIAAYQTVQPHVQAGSAVVLAATGGKRLPALPNVPLVSEYVKGYNMESQLGLLGPANMPPAVVRKLSAALKATLESPDVREQLSAGGTRQIRWTTPEEYTEIIRDNLKKFERAGKLANVKPE